MEQILKPHDTFHYARMFEQSDQECLTTTGFPDHFYRKAPIVLALP